MGKSESQIEFTFASADQKRLRGPSADFIMLCHAATDQLLDAFIRNELVPANPNHNIQIGKIKSANPASQDSDTILVDEKPVNIPQPKNSNLLLFRVGGYDFGNPPDWKRIVHGNHLDRLLFKFLHRQEKPILLVRIRSRSRNTREWMNPDESGTDASQKKRVVHLRNHVVRVSHVLDQAHLKSLENSSSLRNYLMGRLQLLKSPLVENKWMVLTRSFQKPRLQKEIIAPVPAATIRSELQKLRPEQKVMEYQNFELYLVAFNEAPNIMLEIGRSREITFRKAAEGTGHHIDLDDYDVFYLQLFIWDRVAEKIVGAYRIGEGHRLIPMLGKKGFYISSLFKFKPDFIKILYHSVELGRSFIIPEYQKSHMLLLLMWKAIFNYISGNPLNQYVIGPVSISDEYSKISRLLIMDYLNTFHKHPDFGPLVKPKKPFRFIKSKGAEQIIVRNFDKDIRKMDQLISEIQLHSNKMPVLLRHYLKQNAQVIAYNLDPEFKNVLDALMILDLKNLPTGFSSPLQYEAKP